MERKRQEERQPQLHISSENYTPHTPPALKASEGWSCMESGRKCVPVSEERSRLQIKMSLSSAEGTRVGEITEGGKQGQSTRGGGEATDGRYTA